MCVSVVYNFDLVLISVMIVYLCVFIMLLLEFSIVLMCSVLLVQLL